MDILNWLMKWYQSNCDGYWEHLYGINIETLDNPGWSVDINLNDTTFENKIFNSIKYHKSDNDWIICRVENSIFKGGGDSSKLEEIFKIFKSWIESDDKRVVCDEKSSK